MVEWKEGGRREKEEARTSIKRRRLIDLSPSSTSTPLNSSSRSFCSKKLRRLSCSLRLGAQTQRGKFVKRKIEPEASTEVG